MRRISFPLVLLLILIWWVLSGGRGWIAGALGVGLGALLHTGLGGPGGARLSVGGLLGFLPFFLIQSIRGGVDVALRALSPGLPLAPGFFAYQVRLPEGTLRIFFLNTVSLLPGTFSARIEGDELTVHLLADDGSGGERLRRLEGKVGRLFGVELDGGKGTGVASEGRG